MPIRPMDIVKTQEATHLKQMEIQRMQQGQAQISKKFQETVREENTKTTQSEKSENKEYRYDAKEKGNNEYFQQSQDGKKKDKDETDNTSYDSNKGKSIDILI